MVSLDNVTIGCRECGGISGHWFTCSKYIASPPGYQIEIPSDNPRAYLNNVVKKVEEILSKKSDLKGQIRSELRNLPNLDNYTDEELDALMSTEDFDFDNFNWTAFWERMRRYPAGPKTKKLTSVTYKKAKVDLAEAILTGQDTLLTVGEMTKEMNARSDAPVVHPTHYNQGKIEVWDFIVDQDLNFLLGSVIKYVCRAGKKGTSLTIQDLRKAREFLDKEIESETERMKTKNLETYKKEAGL